MSRFYYYLILINMAANIIASVPVILLNHHKDGAVSSMLISIVVGIILVIVYTRFFNSFPGMTLPELLKKTTVKWFYQPFVFFSCHMVYSWFNYINHLYVSAYSFFNTANADYSN